jgi:TonB family protein
MITLRNLRSVGTAAIVEVLIAAGIAGILIWQQVGPLTQTKRDPGPIVDFPEQPPPLQRSIATPQPPESPVLSEVPRVPTSIPTPTTQPVQAPQPPELASQQTQPPVDLAREFSAGMLLAINEQKAYPRVSLLKGETGETVVSFDYVDGVVSDIHVDRSSGSHELDEAAVRAVQRAVLPPKPAELAGLSHFVFHLVFALGG